MKAHGLKVAASLNPPQRSLSRETDMLNFTDGSFIQSFISTSSLAVHIIYLDSMSQSIVLSLSLWS